MDYYFQEKEAMGQFFFTLKLPFDMMIFCFNVFSVVFFSHVDNRGQYSFRCLFC